jgi:hypothetical protein
MCERPEYSCTEKHGPDLTKDSHVTEVKWGSQLSTAFARSYVCVTIISVLDADLTDQSLSKQRCILLQPLEHDSLIEFGRRPTAMTGSKWQQNPNLDAPALQNVFDGDAPFSNTTELISGSYEIKGRLFQPSWIIPGLLPTLDVLVHGLGYNHHAYWSGLNPEFISTR